MYEELDLDFNILIRGLQTACGEMLGMQRDIEECGVDLLTNVSIGTDYYEAFCDIMAEIKDGEYDEDPEEKKFVKKEAKHLVKLHFKALGSVIKRNTQLIVSMVPRMKKTFSVIENDAAEAAEM